MDALPSASASASASCLTWLTTEIRPPTHPPPPTAPSSSKKLPQLCYIFRPARASDSIIQYIKIELFAKCLGALKCSECSICDKNEPLAQLFKFRSSICLRLVVPRITTDHLKCQRSAPSRPHLTSGNSLTTLLSLNAALKQLSTYGNIVAQYLQRFLFSSLVLYSHRNL